MIKIKVGDRIQDNDPRMNGRVLVVTEVQSKYVFAHDRMGTKFRHLLDRIHTDGKPRRSGMSLIGVKQ